MIEIEEEDNELRKLIEPKKTEPREKKEAEGEGLVYCTAGIGGMIFAFVYCIAGIPVLVLRESKAYVLPSRSIAILITMKGSLKELKGSV